MASETHDERRETMRNAFSITEEPPNGLEANETSAIPLQDDVEVPKPETGVPNLSKNQQKKLKRRQNWEDERPARKERRKEKRKQAQERKREAIASGDAPATSKAKRPAQQEAVEMDFIIDCQFEDLMTPEELVSMSGQLTRCYSDRRKSAMKPRLVITSFGGALEERFEGVLNNQHKAWDVEFNPDHIATVTAKASREKDNVVKENPTETPIAQKGSPDADDDRSEDLSSSGEVVYLTSDSPDTLHSLKPHSKYIIGGLIDKNRHKGICYRRAQEMGIQTARLPIGDYMKMSTRHVLTINQVHDIMLKWLECRDWGQAFLNVIPRRKGGELLTSEPDVPPQKETSAEDGERVESFKEAEGKGYKVGDVPEEVT